jgi:RNA polymerase sigma factor (TIGR02999 family)
MAHASPPNVTKLLRAWGKGDKTAFNELIPQVRKELHRLAAHYIAIEPPGHLLQATALVNEVYLRLVDWKDVQWADRANFFGIAANLMRRVLVDYARKQGRLKRGGEAIQVSFVEAIHKPSPQSAEVLALDDALQELERLDPRKSRVVEMRFFGGLNADEIAAALNVSVATVRRDWTLARAWMFRQLSRKNG